MLRRATTVLLLAGLAACGGGGSGGPQAASTPVPTPTPTPEPAGVVRLVDLSLPAGSTVKVAPMFVIGQQAQQLWFTAAITMKADLKGALVRAWVRTDAQRCMGGGQAGVDFQAGVERGVAPASMSHPGSGSAMCALPFTTTHVEFEVFDIATQRTVLATSFPAAYTFVAE
jgi:hypothetical protein